MITHKDVIKTLECVFRSILSECVMRYNTPENRSKITDRFNNRCQPFLDGGLITKFKNICEEWNNPAHLIDQGMCSVYTDIEINNLSYDVHSCICFCSGYVDILSVCRNEEELTNLDREEKLEYILEEEKNNENK
jgi:hypothetical protein